MYGQNSEALAACPGEANCEWFEGAKGETREEKLKNSCFNRGPGPCELLPSKLTGGKKRQEALFKMVESAGRIRVERLSGYPRPPSNMSPIDYEILLILEARIDHAERDLRTLNNRALIAGFGLKVE